MTGMIVLQGGGPFTANDELDRRVLDAAGAGRVVVLPTADAFEHPERLVTAAMTWAERLGGDIDVEALMVLRRGEALMEGAAQEVRTARAVYLVGDQPLHLRSVLKDTPVWDALHDVLADGGAVVGCAGAAAALCDPMVDPRGGAFTLGLGLVGGVALVTTSESWSTERLHRTEKMAATMKDGALVVLPTGSALVRAGSAWELVGDVEVRGQLN
jgi:cyanophycinase